MQNRAIIEASLVITGLLINMGVVGLVLESSREIAVSTSCGAVELTPSRLVVSGCNGEQWIDSNPNIDEVRVKDGEGKLRGILSRANDDLRKIEVR